MLNAFSVPNEITIFFFKFVYVVDHINVCMYIEQSQHLWDEAYLITVNNAVDVFLDLIGKNFIEYFASIFIRDTGL